MLAGLVFVRRHCESDLRSNRRRATPFCEACHVPLQVSQSGALKALIPAASTGRCDSMVHSGVLGKQSNLPISMSGFTGQMRFNR
jgi:hypothetical protein